MDELSKETIGQKRVALTSEEKEDKVTITKRMFADLIDYLNYECYSLFDNESRRCFNIAMDNLETACMYAVKGMNINQKNAKQLQKFQDKYKNKPTNNQQDEQVKID
jgi:hypothetical protein